MCVCAREATKMSFGKGYGKEERKVALSTHSKAFLDSTQFTAYTWLALDFKTSKKSKGDQPHFTESRN